MYEGFKLPEVEQKNIHSIAYLTLLESSKLPLQAKFIWLHLDARAGSNRYVWFNKEAIYKSIGIGKDAYLKYIDILESAGAIVQFKRFNKSNGARSTNIILVCEYNQMEDKFEKPKNINEITNAIKEKFNKYYIFENNDGIKNRNQIGQEGQTKSKIVDNMDNVNKQPKSENPTGGKSVKPIGPKSEKPTYPPLKNRFTPVGKTDSNNRKILIIERDQSINQSKDKKIDRLIDNKNNVNYELFINELKAKYKLSDEELKICLLRLKNKQIKNPIKFFETVVKNYCKNERGLLKDAQDAEKSITLRSKQAIPGASSEQRQYAPGELEKLLLGRE